MKKKLFAWTLAALSTTAAFQRPTGSAQAADAAPEAVTMDQLAEAITDYVAKDSDLKGGYFLVYDKEAKKPLMLRLDKVHMDRLARVYEGVYFACADFKTPDGTVYDLDVFMKGPSADALEATEVSVHKRNGKARYGWVQEEGVWKKKT
jgi:hypothetical protein